MSIFEVDDTKTLWESLNKLYSTKEHSDVTFVVDGVSIPAHRWILVLQSEFFRMLLVENQFQEGQASEIPIEASQEAFELVLKYLYTAKLSLGSFEEKTQVYFELFNLSRLYGIQSLEKTLVNFFLANISPTNVIDIFNVAMLYESKVLGEKCLNQMNKIGSRIYLDDKIAEIPLSCLKQILTSPLVSATIWKVYALQKWLSANPDCPITQKSELAKTINVEKLSNRQISKFLSPSRIFEETYIDEVMDSRKEDVPEEPEEFLYNFQVLIGRRYLLKGQHVIGSSAFCEWVRKSKRGISLLFQSLVFSVSFNTSAFGAVTVSVSTDEGGSWESVKPVKTSDPGYVSSYFVSVEEPFKLMRIFGINEIFGFKLGLSMGLTPSCLIEGEFFDKAVKAETG